MNACIKHDMWMVTECYPWKSKTLILHIYLPLILHKKLVITSIWIY